MTKEEKNELLKEKNGNAYQYFKEKEYFKIKLGIFKHGNINYYSTHNEIVFRKVAAVYNRTKERSFVRYSMDAILGSDALLSEDNQLHIVAYITMRQYIEAIDENYDQLILPKKEKILFLQDIKKIKEKIPFIETVDTFYNEEGKIFDVFEWINTPKEEFFKYLEFFKTKDALGIEKD